MKPDVSRSFFAMIVAFLAVAECAGTTPQSQQALRDPVSGEGTVIGSVWIKGGKDLLGRTRYAIGINRAEKKNTSSNDYTVEARRDGDEEVFVAVLPAGDYRITEFRQLGFSSFRKSMGLVFSVESGRTSYIGRLLIEFPRETITIYTPIKLTVEDAMDVTARAAKDKYGREFDGASARLMAAASTNASIRPGRTTADPRLEEDTLFMIMGMDTAEDADCKQRTLANREIIKADSGGAQEHWTINRCGTLFRYPITYSPGSGGGTVIHYSPPEFVGKTP